MSLTVHHVKAFFCVSPEIYNLLFLAERKRTEIKDGDNGGEVSPN